jgi:lipopolysaccharide export system protein LptA
MRTSNFFKSSLPIAFCLAVTLSAGQVSLSSGAQKPAIHTPALDLTEQRALEPKTEIFSDKLTMVSGEKDNHFLFTGNVEVRATNMVATCEKLEVYSGKDNSNKAPTEPPKPGTPPIGKIERIVAIGNVRVIQDARIATAGRAEIFPQVGKVVLSQSPVVTNKDGVLKGYRITLYQGEQKVEVESDPNRVRRPSIILPQIPDLGAGGNKKPR